jgi:[acyl-carrier-protein] S-malonyltransferase
MNNARSIIVPGQGSIDDGVFALLDSIPFCKQNRDLLYDIIGNDLSTLFKKNGSKIWEQNEISSILNVYITCGMWNMIKNHVSPSAVAGYSVGQWAAMYISKMLSFETLMQHIWDRARLMNKSGASKIGAMGAVIGLSLNKIQSICKQVSLRGATVTVSNINAPGQLTISGHRNAVELALAKALQEGALKTLFIKTTGAWHCLLLEDIIEEYDIIVKKMELQLPHIPITDNVTGKLFDHDLNIIRANLVAHMIQSVNWRGCVQTLTQLNAFEHIELGYGMILTKFNPFIDRRIKTHSYATILKIYDLV